MKLDDTSPLFKQVATSRVFLHLSCFPTEGIDEYYEQEYGDDPSILKAQERNESIYYHRYDPLIYFRVRRTLFLRYIRRERPLAAVFEAVTGEARDHLASYAGHQGEVGRAEDQGP